MPVNNDVNKVHSAVQSIVPAAINATATGAAADLAGYMTALVVVDAGVITDGTHTLKLTECDTSGGSYTDVAAGDLSTTFAALSSGAGGSAVQLVAYVGSKRFIKAVSTVAGATTGGVYGVTIIRGRPRTV